MLKNGGNVKYTPVKLFKYNNLDSFALRLRHELFGNFLYGNSRVLRRIGVTRVEFPKNCQIILGSLNTHSF